MLGKYLLDCVTEETMNLTETVLSDKRITDVYDDMENVITTHYQSLYLHLKALSKYYTIRNDNNKARRIMTLASELASVLDQTKGEVRFRK